MKILHCFVLALSAALHVAYCTSHSSNINHIGISQSQCDPQKSPLCPSDSTTEKPNSKPAEEPNSEPNDNAENQEVDKPSDTANQSVKTQDSEKHPNRPTNDIASNEEVKTSNPEKNADSPTNDTPNQDVNPGNAEKESPCHKNDKTTSQKFDDPEKDADSPTNDAANQDANSGDNTASQESEEVNPEKDAANQDVNPDEPEKDNTMSQESEEVNPEKDAANQDANPDEPEKDNTTSQGSGEVKPIDAEFEENEVPHGDSHKQPDDLAQINYAAVLNPDLTCSMNCKRNYDTKDSDKQETLIEIRADPLRSIHLRAYLPPEVICSLLGGCGGPTEELAKQPEKVGIKIRVLERKRVVRTYNVQ